MVQIKKAKTCSVSEILSSILNTVAGTSNLRSLCCKFAFGLEEKPKQKVGKWLKSSNCNRALRTSDSFAIQDEG